MRSSTIPSLIKRGAIVYLILIALLVLLAFFFVRSDSSPAVENFTQFKNTPASSSFSGESVPETAPTLGPKDAKITIVEFADFGCPYCKQASTSIRQLVNQYPESIRLVYRHFPVEELHPGATVLAHASFCAQEQGKFWELHDKFFQEQDQFDPENILTLIRSIGMNSQEFLACQASNSYEELILQDLSDGLALGARGTPTWLVNGQRIEGAIPLSLWETIIQDLL